MGRNTRKLQTHNTRSNIPDITVAEKLREGGELMDHAPGLCEQVLIKSALPLEVEKFGELLHSGGVAIVGIDKCLPQLGLNTSSILDFPDTRISQPNRNRSTLLTALLPI